MTFIKSLIIFYTFKELKFVNEDEERDYDVFISENMVKFQRETIVFLMNSKKDTDLKLNLKREYSNFYLKLIRMNILGEH